MTWLPKTFIYLTVFMLFNYFGRFAVVRQK